MRYRVYPYKIYSQSAREIAGYLGGKRVRPEGRYRPRSKDIIVNWGNKLEPSWKYNEILNPPDAVAVAINKLKTFNALLAGDIRVPPFTTDSQEAREWKKVVVRHLLTGNSGKGIDIWKKGAGELPTAPLYTKYIDTRDEYRVHVFRGEVIDYAKKIKHDENGNLVNASTDDIRNHYSRWLFARNGYERRASVIEIAQRAVGVLGLDFGAVDVIKSSKGNSFVLEVNTAPGLSPRGVLAYVNAIRKVGGEEPLEDTIEDDEDDEGLSIFSPIEDDD